MSDPLVTQPGALLPEDVEAVVLRLAAAHRFVRLSHVCALVGDRAAGAVVVERLVAAGWLRRWRLAPSDPGCLVITERGLARVDRELPLPEFDFGRFRHDAAVPGVWVAAVLGKLGRVRELWTQRELQAHAPEGSSRATLGVRVAGERALHFADLVVETGGGLIALYLQLAVPAPRQLMARFTAYGTDPRWRQIVHLVEDDRVAERVAEAAASVGLSELVRCQLAVLG